MRAEDRDRLAHMIDAADAMAAFVAGRAREDLDSDRMVLFAVVRAIEVLGEIAHGASHAEILKDYPDLEPDDLREAMEYAAWLTHEEIHPAAR